MLRRSVEGAGMYFSKTKKSMFLKKIRSERFCVYEIKLYAGECDCEEDLRWMIERMFTAWRTIVFSRNRGYMKQFAGIMRRLFIDFDGASGMYRPYFYLVCIRGRKPMASDDSWEVMLDEEKIRIMTYIKWLSAWVRALRQCTDVKVDFSLVELEGLEALVNNFFTNEKYSFLAVIDELKKQVLRRVCGEHHLVSFHGVFRELNRHVSVER